MRALNDFRKPNGQAMSEMVIAIPVLFLFMASIIQFSIIFLSYVQFDHACGESARQYVAGIVDENSLDDKIYENLGHFQIFFDRGSLSVSTQEPRSTVGATMDNVKNAIRFIPLAINYEGYEWSVRIRCNPPFFAKILFPEGLPLHTVMQVYRYSK